jgi:hypothetical protein
MKLAQLLLIPLLTLMLGLSGCAVNQATATRAADMDMKAIKTIYVVQHADDKYKVAELIRDDLTKRGYQVTVGNELQPPYPTDAVVKYIDKWMWDITVYMIELTITVRNPSNDFPTLNGHSLHTSLTRKSPQAMVQEVLDNIIKTK